MNSISTGVKWVGLVIESLHQQGPILESVLLGASVECLGMLAVAVFLVTPSNTTHMSDERPSKHDCLIFSHDNIPIEIERPRRAIPSPAWLVTALEIALEDHHPDMSIYRGLFVNLRSNIYEHSAPVLVQ